MANEDAGAAWEYHDRTKHSLASVRASRHTLDWENQPLPYKIYPDLAPIPLPSEGPEAAMPALDAIAVPGTVPAAPATLTTAALARLLHLSAGVVRKRVYAGGQEVYYRAAACTGALYHIDLYPVCGPLPDLEAGVYHFGPHDFALRRLRPGDHRAALVEASGGEPAVAAAPVVLACASTFWRNAWKYQARTFRHAFWDTGTILANLLAAAAGAGIPARVVAGFVDAAVNHLLGLDGEREAALVLVALGYDAGARPGPAPPAEPLVLATLPLSRREIDYPAIGAAYAASSLASPAEVVAWRGGTPAPAPPAAVTAPAVALAPLAAPPADTVDAVVRRRGSVRELARVPIGLAELSTLLARATGPVPADFAAAAGGPLADAYLIVHAVDGLASGAYVLHRGGGQGHGALELLRAGDFRREAGFLDLGQELAADASVNVYLLADLHRALARFGNRGYRAAQLEAAITGGRLYLAAYALGLGATGLTFFDDDVTAFFSPHAARKSVMFLIAAGRPRRRRLPVTE